MTEFDHYEWSGWLWCENKQEPFDWVAGEIDCPHCGRVISKSERYA